MRRKVFYFLLFTLFAVNCMAFNLSAYNTKTSQKADNPLIEDGYDIDADTVMEYYGKPIQHLTSFTNNTITLSCPTPKPLEGLLYMERL